MVEPLGPELVAEGQVYRPRRPRDTTLAAVCHEVLHPGNQAIVTDRIIGNGFNAIFLGHRGEGVVIALVSMDRFLR